MLFPLAVSQEIIASNQDLFECFGVEVTNFFHWLCEVYCHSYQEQRLGYLSYLCLSITSTKPASPKHHLLQMAVLGLHW